MPNYTNPSTVVSPQDCVSNVHVLFDGGDSSFSIAEMDWQGVHTYGIRWNVSYREWQDPDKVNGLKPCLGMPISNTRPVWFILPDSVTPVLIQQIIANAKASQP